MKKHQILGKPLQHKASLCLKPSGQRSARKLRSISKIPQQLHLLTPLTAFRCLGYCRRFSAIQADRSTDSTRRMKDESFAAAAAARSSHAISPLMRQRIHHRGRVRPLPLDPLFGFQSPVKRLQLFPAKLCRLPKIKIIFSPTLSYPGSETSFRSTLLWLVYLQTAPSKNDGHLSCLPRPFLLYAFLFRY